jgi:hypothetical protein
MPTAMPELELLEFSLIPDGNATAWRENVPVTSANGLDYACGLFVLGRK